MKRSLIIVVLIAIGMLLIQRPVMAQSPRDTSAMSTANQLYQDGQYVEAALVYQQLVDQGIQDAALYYNLGNAYYNQGELGRAIANYLRAEQISPRDPDIQANLEAARSQIKDSFGSAGRSLFSRWVDNVSSWVTLNELAIAALILWTIFGFSIFIFLLFKFRWIRRVMVYTAVISGIFLAVAALTLAGRISEDRVNPDVVVVVEIVDAVEGPGSQFANEFILRNGTEAFLKDKRGIWVKLALPDGQQEGWVPANTIEEVAPNDQERGIDWSLPFL